MVMTLIEWMAPKKPSMWFSIRTFDGLAMWRCGLAGPKLAMEENTLGGKHVSKKQRSCFWFRQSLRLTTVEKKILNPSNPKLLGSSLLICQVLKNLVHPCYLWGSCIVSAMVLVKHESMDSPPLHRYHTHPLGFWPTTIVGKTRGGVFACFGT